MSCFSFYLKTFEQNSITSLQIANNNKIARNVIGTDPHHSPLSLRLNFDPLWSADWTLRCCGEKGSAKKSLNDYHASDYRKHSLPSICICMSIVSPFSSQFATTMKGRQKSRKIFIWSHNKRKRNPWDTTMATERKFCHNSSRSFFFVLAFQRIKVISLIIYVSFFCGCGGGGSCNNM